MSINHSSAPRSRLARVVGKRLRYWVIGLAGVGSASVQVEKLCDRRKVPRHVALFFLA